MKILRLYDADEGTNATIGYMIMPEEGLEAVRTACSDYDVGVEEIEIHEFNNIPSLQHWLSFG